MVENYNGMTRPLWIDTAPGKRFPEFSRLHLDSTKNVDVVIVGGGITGITTALRLKKAGKKVVVIEMNRVGSGETGHTSAHLTEFLDVNYSDLINDFGLSAASLVAQSVRHAIQDIEDTVSDHNIPCGFKRLPAYKYTESEKDVSELEKESESLLRVQIANTFSHDVPLPFTDAVKAKACIRLDHQAQLHPSEYLHYLANLIPGDGSFVFEDTRVINVHEGEPCKIETNRGTILCDDVIMAANVPVLNKFLLQTKIASYRTYAMALLLKENQNFEGLFYDTEDPYHYLRTHSYGGKNYLIVGGEDHKTGQEDHTDLSFQKLEDFARARFDVDSVEYRWSGQVVEPVDGLPFIGQNPMSEHVYVATGFSGTGLTFGTMAAKLISDLILKQENEWATVYSPSRIKPLASVRSFLAENIDYPSHLIGDRLTPADDGDAILVRENEGRIVRFGAKKVAAYRDPKGELHLLSPVCPHMGCYVGWNEAEKSWDCPCHGARFSPTGQVLNGPAVTDLASEEVDSDLLMQPERFDYPNGDQPDPLNPGLGAFTCPCKA